MNRLAKIVARAGAELRALVHRIADDLRGGLFDEAFEKLVVDRVLDDEAFGGDAALRRCSESARSRRSSPRPLEIGVGEHDERVGAAEFEHAFL